MRLKARTVHTHTRSEPTGFNPTVVRLKVELRIGPAGAHCRFNPTVVRLKVLTRVFGEVPVVMFQSHCGAIKSALWGTAVGNQMIRFNPTVVRLKGTACGMRAECPQTGFNPTVVRLKGASRNGESKLNPGFNPTVVRLKVAHGLPYLSLYDAVSIPLWCD